MQLLNWGVSMNQYIAYIEETLHVNANASIYEHGNALPLYLRSAYNLYTLTIQNVRCLLAQPKEQANLTALRNQCAQLKKLTGLDSVLCLESVRIYTKEKMLSEGIPFIIANQQVYMPFLGIALSNNGAREILQKDRLSFSTQKLLLTAIYQGWTGITLTETAKALGMSKMTVTRSFDEILALGLQIVKSEGKVRRFIWEDSRRALWEAALPFLRNPVTIAYRLGEQKGIDSKKLGGMSAICRYSMLADNPYTVYAVSSDTAKALGLNKQKTIPDDETPVMVVQVMRYELDYSDTGAVDPLTAILSLTDDDKKDPRVEAAIEEILEDCLHG
jgi:AcrR family transcriptional regulator